MALSLSDIWGAKDPEPKQPKPKNVMDSEIAKQWASHYMNEIHKKGFLTVLVNRTDTDIMKILKCSHFELIDLHATDYFAFTCERLQEICIDLMKYRDKNGF